MVVTIVDILYSIILIYTLYIQRFLQGKIYHKRNRVVRFYTQYINSATYIG